MRTIALLISLFFTAQTWAQTLVSMSLKEAIQYAEQNSPSFQNSKTDVQIAEQTVKNIKSIGLPQVNATASFMDYLQIPGSYIKNFTGGPPDFIFLRFQQKYSATGTIALNQLLFDGTYFLGLQAAKDYVILSETLVSKSLTELHMNVAKAYLLAVNTEKNIDLINGNLEVLERSLKEVSAMYDEGFVEKLDVQRLQLAVSNLKIQRQKLENAVLVTQNLLKLQIGMNVATPLKLTDDLETVNSIIPLTEAAGNDFNIQNRIEYKLLNQSIGLSLMDEKRYKLGYMPSLVGFLQHQRSTNRSEFNFFQSNLPINNDFIPSTLIGLNLSVPVFDGFRKQSQIMDVRLKRQKTENDLKLFENAANLEYNNAKMTYEVNLKQATELKLNMDLAKEIYEKSNIKFTEGVGSSFEIIQAQNDLKTAQTNYMNSLYDLAVSKLELKKSTGNALMD